MAASRRSRLLTLCDAGHTLNRSTNPLGISGFLTALTVRLMSAEPSIEIQINGDSRCCPESHTVADLLETLGLKPKFVAVERNEQLVPRAQHAECRLSAGDRIEIVTLVGGG